MKIIDLKHPDEPFSLAECGLVLGNFDGVHRGHQALITELQRLQKETGAIVPLGALCFSEPPSHYFGHPVPQLTTNEEKMALFKRAGLRFVIFYDFPEIAALSPEEFVIKILIGECNCRLAVCGYNYTFGKGAKGTAEDLASWLGTQPRRAVSVIPPVTDGRHTVSSTLIREMLERGHPEDAARLMGHPYTLKGRVTSGKHVGRTLGFPTANLTFPEGLLVPAHGVYAVSVRTGNHTYYGIANVGIRPSFDDGDHVTCETFLFEFRGDLYDRELTVSFLHFLREEKQFSSPVALREQIHRDIKAAMDYF